MLGTVHFPGAEGREKEEAKYEWYNYMGRAPWILAQVNHGFASWNIRGRT